MIFKTVRELLIPLCGILMTILIALDCDRTYLDVCFMGLMTIWLTSIGNLIWLCCRGFEGIKMTVEQGNEIIELLSMIKPWLMAINIGVWVIVGSVLSR